MEFRSTETGIEYKPDGCFGFVPLLTFETSPLRGTKEEMAQHIARVLNDYEKPYLWSVCNKYKRLSDCSLGEIDAILGYE